MPFLFEDNYKINFNNPKTHNYRRSSQSQMPTIIPFSGPCFDSWARIYPKPKVYKIYVTFRLRARHK